MAVATVGLLHWLGQARISHAIEHVPHALRVVGRQHGQDLVVQRVDSLGGTAITLYVTGTIGCRC
jgi:hypothetical protein